MAQRLDDLKGYVEELSNFALCCLGKMHLKFAHETSIYIVHFNSSTNEKFISADAF